MRATVSGEEGIQPYKFSGLVLQIYVHGFKLKISNTCLGEIIKQCTLLGWDYTTIHVPQVGLHTVVHILLWWIYTPIHVFWWEYTAVHILRWDCSARHVILWD